MKIPNKIPNKIVQGIVLATGLKSIRAIAESERKRQLREKRKQLEADNELS